jgi:putative FmdB family regulatory protein
MGSSRKGITMPLYTFQCDKCQTKEDVLKKVSEADTMVKCVKCDGEMHRIFDVSNTSFELKGPGWFKTDGKY